LPRRGLDRDERRARAVAPVRALRRCGRRRHVGGLRAVQRHRDPLVRAAPRRRRGLAVGLALRRLGLGTLVRPPLAHVLSARVGWRVAYVVFGVGILVVLSAGATIMRRDPESAGLHPDGDAAAPRHAAGGDARAWTLAAAARTRTFWMLLAVFTATWVPV